MINSIANLGGYLGPYMLGVIKQTTGSTDGGYFALGGMLIVSGLVMLTLPKTQSVRSAEKAPEEQPDVSADLNDGGDF